MTNTGRTLSCIAVAVQHPHEVSSYARETQSVSDSSNKGKKKPRISTDDICCWWETEHLTYFGIRWFFRFCGERKTTIFFVVLSLGLFDFLIPQPRWWESVFCAQRMRTLWSSQRSVVTVCTFDVQKISLLCSYGVWSALCMFPSCDIWYKFHLPPAFICAVTSVSLLNSYDGSQDLATAECYNPRVNKWSNIAAMGAKRSCAGGSQICDRKPKAFCGMLHKFLGSLISPMLFCCPSKHVTIARLLPHYITGTCQWNGLIYVMGGYDGASCLSSVERYDPLTLTWTSIAAMNFKRRYLRVTCLGETDIFDFLGRVSRCCGRSPSPTNSLRTASLVRAVSEMQTRLKIFSCQLKKLFKNLRNNKGTGFFLPDGCIFALGGHDGSCHMSSVEVLDPEVSFCATRLNHFRSYQLLMMPTKGNKRFTLGQWGNC